MTWTWDDTDLSTTLAQVRLGIGDTNTHDQLLTDEQINLRLAQYDSDVIGASVRCVRDILAKLARDTDRSNVGMSASRSQKFQQYKDLLVELQSEFGSICEMTFTGLSEDDEDTVNDDDDYIQSNFGIGKDNNHG